MAKNAHILPKKAQNGSKAAHPHFTEYFQFQVLWYRLLQTVVIIVMCVSIGCKCVSSSVTNSVIFVANKEALTEAEGIGTTLRETGLLE